MSIAPKSLAQFVSATALAALLPLAAAAQESMPWYVGGFLLVDKANTDSVERTPAQATPLSDFTDSGGVSVGAGGVLGYNWKPSYQLPFRTEIGATWRYRQDANVAFTDVATTGSFAAKSDVQTTDLMASLLWDIPLGWKLQPYVGGGIGAAYSDIDSYLLNPTNVGGPNRSEWNFAWQLQGGVTYPLTQRLSFRADYRYIDLGSITTGVLPTATGDSFEYDYTAHDLRLGVQYAF